MEALELGKRVGSWKACSVQPFSEKPPHSELIEKKALFQLQSEENGYTSMFLELKEDLEKTCGQERSRGGTCHVSHAPLWGSIHFPTRPKTPAGGQAGWASLPGPPRTGTAFLSTAPGLPLLQAGMFAISAFRRTAAPCSSNDCLIHIRVCLYYLKKPL